MAKFEELYNVLMDAVERKIARSYVKILKSEPLIALTQDYKSTQWSMTDFVIIDMNLDYTSQIFLADFEFEASGVREKGTDVLFYTITGTGVASISSQGDVGYGNINAHVKLDT